MLNILRNGVGICCTRFAFLAVEKRKLDENKLQDPLIRDPDSGIDRVLKIFDRDENGSISPELAMINMSAFCGMFFGGIHGGILQLKNTHMTFRECNEATLFTSNFEAQRLLQNASTVGFGKGAFRWGWRCGFFAFSFIGISTIISAYRAKTSVLDYTVAGGVTGAILKFNLGPKGMISGGFFGALLGSFGGLLTVAMLKVSGATLQEVQQQSMWYTKAMDRFLYHFQRTQLEEPDDLLDSYHVDDFNKSVSLDILSDDLIGGKNETTSKNIVNDSNNIVINPK